MDKIFGGGANTLFVTLGGPILVIAFSCLWANAMLTLPNTVTSGRSLPILVGAVLSMYALMFSGSFRTGSAAVIIAIAAVSVAAFIGISAFEKSYLLPKGYSVELTDGPVIKTHLAPKYTRSG